jgi:hypothetical protein
MNKQNYFEVPAVSRAVLTAMLSSPRKAKEKFYEKMPGKHFEIGTLVDNLVTSEEAFSDVYHVSKIPKPTGKIGDVAYNVLLEILQGKEYSRELVIKCRELVGYDKTMKEDTFVETFEGKSRCKDWIIEQAEGKDKIVIDEDTYNLGMRIYMSFLNCPEINELLSSNGIEFQPEIYWEYGGQKCKAKPDFLIKNGKTILLGDIKTTGESTAAFRQEVRRYRYDIQAAWYSFGVSEVYKGYEILPFVFVVETTEKSRIGSPLIYEMTKKDLDIARYGIHRNSMTPLYEEGNRIKGFEELFKEFVWHSNSGQWDYSYEEYTQNKKLKLDIWQ